MSSLPSGVRLVALLNEHLGDIMGRERTNTASIHLYCTGPYWVAFSTRPISCAVCSRIARLRRCACSATRFLW